MPMGEPKCGLCGSDLVSGMFHYCSKPSVCPDCADLKKERDCLKSIIDDLREFIGDTFYANVSYDQKPAPNSWYKETSKTYGGVLAQILARVPVAPKCDVTLPLPDKTTVLCENSKPCPLHG